MNTSGVGVMEAPLAGLRVVELSAFVAAPLGGATLASLGAEVIRVDPPGGGIDFGRWPLHEGSSLYWAGLNRGKRSVTIDTRSERGRDLVARLVADAGTLLTNLPGRGELAFEALSARRPDLVMVSITGNPDGSPAVDYTVNAGIGFPWITGPEGHDGPVNHVLPAWDVATGLYAATGLLAADRQRLRTGEGTHVRVSLSDVALAVAGHLGFIDEARLVAEPRGRFGNDLFGTYARDFRTSDGRHLIALALTPRQWSSLARATGIEGELAAIEARLGLDLRREGDRWQARREISALLEAWAGARTLADAARALTEHGALWGPYRTFKEVVANDPRVARLPASPLDLGGDRPPAPPGPRLGADTEAVLSELGEDYGALRAAGLV